MKCIQVCILYTCLPLSFAYLFQNCYHFLKFVLGHCKYRKTITYAIQILDNFPEIITTYAKIMVENGKGSHGEIKVLNLRTFYERFLHSEKDDKNFQLQIRLKF